MRLTPRFILPLVLLMLIISYQNFSGVQESDWDSAVTLKIMQEMKDFEKKDQGAVTPLATPQSGSDLKSVSNDWVERQGSLILNGYDKKIEAKVNDKLNTWVRLLSPKKNDEEPPPPNTGANSKESPKTQESPTRENKQNLRFSRVNSLKYDLGTNSCLDLTADPGNTRFNFSQALTSNTKLGLEHRTLDNKTQMTFKYEW